MPRRSAPRDNEATSFDARIEHVGSDGDGVARLADGQSVYVAWTLPGEAVRGTASSSHAARHAREAEILAASPDRVPPPCPHFGECGGCVLQHWAAGPYAAWKSGLVATALERAGFVAPPVGAAPPTPPGGRRRMDLALQRTPAGIAVGLHARRSSRVVDLATCLVLHPALVGLIAPLRPLLASLSAFRRTGSAIANLLDAGADLLLRLDAPPSPGDRQRLVAFAAAQRLVRLSCAVGTGEPETVCQFRPASVAFADVAVQPPPGGFLQASREGEAAIVAAVLAALPDRLPRRAWIADLFAGCGTLTFPLARHARVAAFEGDAAAVAALRQATNAAQLAGRVTATQRDLARRPLLAHEFAGCAAAILDPPYGGAGPQIAPLAAALVPRVVYVSCDPAALGRDSAILRAAGYRLEQAVAIDQFLWSARVESVCVFVR